MEHTILILILHFLSFLILGLAGMRMKNGLAGAIGTVSIYGHDTETLERIYSRWFLLSLDGKQLIYHSWKMCIRDRCYVPEYAAEDREDWRVSESSDGCFTHNSLLALCKGRCV